MLELDKSNRQDVRANTRTLLSIVTPAYNEAENLPLFYERLSNALKLSGVDWEWIVIDDHSADDTFATVADIAVRDARVHAIRLAKNSGSHMATVCGLDHARGHCAASMATDLQDPPEVLPALLKKWFGGAQVVWAVRRRREGVKASAIGVSRLYYMLMRHLVGLKKMPPTGADIFLLDRQVLDAFLEFKESNVSVLALLSWMGFRQETISYDKQARSHGRSGWTLKKKLKLLVDSITSFTFFPIRVMSYVGFLFAFAGFVYAGLIIENYFAGNPAEGWSSIMVVVLVIGGMQMLMMGVLGEYLWRALDESRRRPRYLIESATDSQSDTIQRQSYG